MDSAGLSRLLASLPLGPCRYFDRLDSTNAEAARWAAQGAPDLAMVVADEQTAGRGRLGRRWFTPPGAALAFSLVLQLSASPSGTPAGEAHLTRLPALGALALSDALLALGLNPQIKWPNDVLVHQHKLAGVLAETCWQGDQPLAAVLGIGVNISPAAVPQAGWSAGAPAAPLYPASCVETALGRPVDRWQLLCATLAALLSWRPRLASAEFLQTWEDRLAFRGQWVQVTGLALGPEAAAAPLAGQLLGLNSAGALRLQTADGEILLVQAGDLSLRPAPQ